MLSIDWILGSKYEGKLLFLQRSPKPLKIATSHRHHPRQSYRLISISGQFFEDLKISLTCIGLVLHALTHTVSIPLPLLKDLYEHFDRMEEILATLEELSDKKGLKRIATARAQYKKGEYTTVSSSEGIRAALLKD